MQKFISLPAKDGAPLLLPTDITNIAVVNSTDTRRPGDREILLASRRAPSAGHFSEQGWGINPADIVGALRAAGKTLIEMPYVWDEKRVGSHYVDPSAVTFITTSAASQRGTETEASMAVLIGLKGGGYVETYAVPEKTVQQFMAAVRAANPTVRQINPDTATSRFYKFGFTAYDPADIVRIYPNGSQVNVLYRDGYCSDFNLLRVDHVNQQLNKLFNRVVRMRGNTKDVRDATWTDKPLMDRIVRHCHQYERRTETKLRRAFAAAIAADCPDLYSFPQAEEFYYTSLKNVSRVTFAGRDPRDLYVDYIESTPEGRGMHAGGRHVRMKDEAAAHKALKDLLRQPS